MGEIFTNHVSDDLTSKIYKELIYNSIAKKKKKNKEKRYNWYSEKGEKIESHKMIKPQMAKKSQMQNRVKAQGQQTETVMNIVDMNTNTSIINLNIMIWRH